MFESIGKKLTDLGTVAVKRTKNVGDRVSLTAKIEAAKRELNGIYAQLGQQVFQNLQEDVPAEYQALFDKINRVEETLADYQSQRRVLRKVRPCPECGTDVPNDAAFCSNCGSHLGIDEEPADDEDEDLFEEDIPSDEAPAQEASDAPDQAAEDAAEGDGEA